MMVLMYALMIMYLWLCTLDYDDNVGCDYHCDDDYERIMYL